VECNEAELGVAGPTEILQPQAPWPSLSHHARATEAACWRPSQLDHGTSKLA
jgi:hypothetical protein